MGEQSGQEPAPGRRQAAPSPDAARDGGKPAAVGNLRHEAGKGGGRDAQCRGDGGGPFHGQLQVVQDQKERPARGPGQQRRRLRTGQELNGGLPPGADLVGVRADMSVSGMPERVRADCARGCGQRKAPACSRSLRLWFPGICAGVPRHEVRRNTTPGRLGPGPRHAVPCASSTTGPCTGPPRPTPCRRW